MGSRRRPTPTTLVLVLLLHLYCAPRRAFSLSFSLNFSDPSAGSWVDLDGDASFAPPRLELTENVQSSVGRASYRYKVPLWNGATGETASFTTNFSFRIMPEKAGLNGTGGDGMAFFIGHFPSEIPPSSKGGGLGLLPAFINGTGRTRIVAVEFDTLRNSHYADINGNHVGIDVSSVTSVASTDTTTRPGKNLTSSYVMEATVRYHNESRMLAVDLLIDDALYQVSATVDLSRCLPEEVAVGFSGATGDASELHQILSWSFSSTLPPLPKRKSRKKLVMILLSVLVPLLLLIVCATVVLWRRHKKMRANKDSQERCIHRADLERGVAAGGPRRYTYHELVAATKHFAEEEKLGRGGFGSVYRGHLTLTSAPVPSCGGGKIAVRRVIGAGEEGV